MRLLLLHCSLAIFQDRRGSNRPGDITRYSTEESRAGISHVPSSNSLLSDDAKLAQLIGEFEHIELDNLAQSPFELRIDYLTEKLRIDYGELMKLLAQARTRGLLNRMTIDLDYEKWVESSSDKGCLVVMASVEARDLPRQGEVVKDATREITTIGNDLSGKNGRINDIIVVPNAHLVARDCLAAEHKQSWALLLELSKALRECGLQSQVASYGYNKFVHLVIHGHPEAFVLRSV